jgi:ribose/xylose/arabinose/galactoside ABC-type transport system permease subunit
VLQKAKKLILKYNSVIIVLLLFLFGISFVDNFINSRSIFNTLLEISLYGMIAIGLSLVMITGAIDLSVGYVAGFSAVLTVLLVNITGSIWVGVLTALAAGVIMGMINGSIVTKLGISPLIATIATNYIYKGLSYAVTNKESLRSNYPELAGVYKFRLFDQTYLSLSILVFAAVLIALWIFMKYTKKGLNIYITGGNAEAGELAGINTKRTLLISYALCGLCCAIAGIFMASLSNAAFYTQGSGRDMFAISACIIGGLKMAGGSGTMTNVLIGIVIMRLISTIMNLTAVPSSWVDFVSGTLLIVVLIIDRFTKKQENA